jgi:hypothetical protein
MMKTYSQNDLIRFLYNETNQSEDHGITYQLEDDGSYNECFKDLLKAKRILNSLKLSPSQNKIDHLLTLSKNPGLLAV